MKEWLCCSQVLMDLSCGSGLFTRRFVGSNKFKGVIAADYSESMLQQTQELFNKDEQLDRRSAPAEITGFIARADCLSAHVISAEIQNTRLQAQVSQYANHATNYLRI